MTISYKIENTDVDVGISVTNAMPSEGDYIIFTQLKGNGIAGHVMFGRHDTDGNTYFYVPQINKMISNIVTTENYIAYPVIYL